MPIVDIDWLKEHVDVPADLTVEQLSQDLVRIGLETETIHRSSVTGPVVVGRIVDFVKEPQKNGKTVSWCQVDCGEEHNVKEEDGTTRLRGIICGAPNVEKDALVVVALPGAVLPGDFAISVRKTYGHKSEGMCCSARELGMGDDHHGIILLRGEGFSQEELKNIKPGDDALSLLHLNIPTLEINITPDRGYAFSYRGVAREYHHSTGEPFTDPIPELAAQAPQVEAGHQGDVEAAIEDDNPIHGVVGCDRYYLRAVHGFDPNAKTPNWMRRRLIRAGVRPHTLAVDVTNYVMLDLGQPLHAYDLDKLVPPIVVRRAHEGEKLVTLDGDEHVLSVEDLVITDSPNGERSSRILGLAGVMGGQYGEITADTKNILVESAHFDTVSIARTARRHKLPTDASHRFERGVDYAMQPAAAQDAIHLLTRYGQGVASDNPTDLNTTKEPQPIAFKVGEVKRLANLDTSTEDIAAILEDIGCTVAGGGNGTFTVTPPTWRPDLTIAPDLVEEVARLVGYDKIPTRIPSVPVVNPGLTPFQARQRKVAATLAEAGLVETLSYPFVGEKDFEEFALNAEQVKGESVEVRNPLAGDRPFMRTNLLYTLARTAQRNLRRGMRNVQIYEIGHVYRQDPHAPAIPALPGSVKPSEDQLKALEAGLPAQPLQVAAVLTGEAVAPGWWKDSRAIDWSDAVALARRVGERIGAQLSMASLDKATNLPSDFNAGTWHPGRTAVVSFNGVYLGVAGELHPEVNKTLGLPEHSAAFNLDLTALFDTLSLQPLQAKPISTFPPVREDLAFMVEEKVSAQQLIDAIRRGGGEALESVELFDVYRGSDLGEGKKSLAFSVVYRSDSQTLTAAQAKEIRAAIVAQCEKDLNAVLRV